MKTSLRRVCTLVLALVLTLSCIGIPAFAADPVRQYGTEGGYLAIGDSVTRGCGTAGYFNGQYYDFDQRNVDGAFPYAVAQAVGCTTPTDIYDPAGNYWPMSFPGMTTGVLNDLYGVEDDFSDVDFDYGNYDWMIENFGYAGSSVSPRGEAFNGTAKVGGIDELTKKASLITVEIGMCDVFYRALVIATEHGSFAGGFNIDFSDPDAMLEFAKIFLEEMYKGYNYWLKGYPMLLAKIRELNPDAAVVVVGAYNMLHDVELTEDSIIPVGTAVAALTESMNAKYRQWAAQYNCIYADIANTEPLAAEANYDFVNQYLADRELACHPAASGNAYIGRQVLACLPRQSAADPEVSTDIVVDLGRFKSVSSVMVDGKYVKGYSMDGTVLTVPYSGKNAKVLTVSILGEDWKLAVQTYTLKYTDSGYTAFRLYGNNDLAATAKKAVNNTKKVVSAIGNLFKK